jgi:hypothetical protein
VNKSAVIMEDDKMTTIVMKNGCGLKTVSTKDGITISPIGNKPITVSIPDLLNL